MSRVKVDITADKSGLDTALKGVEHSIEGLKGMVVGAFSVEAVRGIVEKTVEYAETIDKTSLRMKMTTEQTQALSIVAREAGTSLETIEGAFKKIETARAKALGGNAASLKAFKALGISTADLSKPNNTLGLAGQLSSAARNGSTDTAGVALGGLGLKKSAGDLAALGESLNNFGEKVDELKAKGAIIPDEDIANIIRAKDELGIVSNEAIAKIAPIISRIIEGLEEGWIIVSTTAENVIAEIILMAENAVNYIKGLKDSFLKDGKNIAAGTVKGLLTGGVVGGIIGGVTATGKDGTSIASKTEDFVTKQKDIADQMHDTNNKEITDKLNAYEKNIADQLAARAKARENKPEAAATVTAPKEKTAKLYSDALTQSGNLIGASFKGAGGVVSALDVSKRQLTTMQSLDDKATAQTELLKSIADNTAGNDSDDDWN